MYTPDAPDPHSQPSTSEPFPSRLLRHFPRLVKVPLGEASVLGSHKVRKRGRFLVVVVVVVAVGRSDVLHEVAAAALGAAFEGRGAIHLFWRLLAEWCVRGGFFGLRQERKGWTYAEPFEMVTVGWVARASGELLLSERFDHDGVFEGACCFHRRCVSPGFFLGGGYESFIIRQLRPCKRRKTELR